jgi:hypothetical protein
MDRWAGAAATLLGWLLLAGCTLPPLTTPTPRPSPTPSPTLMPTPTASPTAMPTPSPPPTPDPAAIPRFDAGEIVATTFAGLRVRRAPDTDGVVATGLLGHQAEVQVIMGPVVSDAFGWYLVADADADEPTFSEGWLAAGYDPEPFLTPAGRPPEADPYLATFAHVGAGEFGPVTIADANHAIRWLAFDPERVGCTFSVSLTPAGAQPIPAIRATVGAAQTPGTLQPQYFSDQASIRGQVFVSVTGDCAWTMVIVQVPPPEAEPTASG